MSLILPSMQIKVRSSKGKPKKGGGMVSSQDLDLFNASRSDSSGI